MDRMGIHVKGESGRQCSICKGPEAGKGLMGLENEKGSECGEEQGVGLPEPAFPIDTEERSTEAVAGEGTSP